MITRSVSADVDVSEPCEAVWAGSILHSLTVDADERQAGRYATIPRVGNKGRRIAAVATLGLTALAALGMPGQPATVQARPNPSPPAAGGHAAVLPVSVGVRAISAPIRPGFVGLSVEFWALRAYTGANTRRINPVLVQLIRNLAPGQSPVLRVGGDSTDASWWPVRGLAVPPGVNYKLSRGWMRTTRALAATLHARLILGVNLEAGMPRIAAAEARAFMQRIGRRYIEAFEIGNEPDLYNAYPWYATTAGQLVFGRSPTYGLPSFIKQFTRWRSVLPTVPIAGPALATVAWMNQLGQFLAAEHGVRIATVHRYPLSSCEGRTQAPDYPTIDHLLSSNSTVGLAKPLRRYVAVANAHHALLRVAEMNSVSCKGKRGVSDTFASALWVLDTLFRFARAGVAGVNVHTLPSAAYELFTFSHARHRFTAFVHPEYYGLQLFALAAPPGSRLVSVTAPAGPVKAWATRGPVGRLRVVLINLDRHASRIVTVRLPGPGGPALLDLLRAPSVSSTGGVTLAGLSYGDGTTTGKLQGVPQTVQLHPVSAGVYEFELPPASAALLTR